MMLIICLTNLMCELKYIRSFITALFIYCLVNEGCHDLLSNKIVLKLIENK
jgi:hypothetical protein